MESPSRPVIVVKERVGGGADISRENSHLALHASIWRGGLCVQVGRGENKRNVM